VLITLNIFSKTDVSKEIFPTLAGLQRTSFHDWLDDCEDSYSTLNAPTETITINDKLYVRFGGWKLREEDNQVLIYSSAYNKDLVLYDWTLEVGDSLSRLAVDYYSFDRPSVVDYQAIIDADENGNMIIKKLPLDKMPVTEVSSVTLLDGKVYKKWVFKTGHMYIEGIGFVSSGDYCASIIDSQPIPACYLGEYLVCVSRDDQLLYTIEKDVQKRLGAACQCLNEGIETNVETIDAPVASFRKTLQDGHLLILHDGKTYNVMGVEVK
jgi:hypothetical protein